MDLVDFCLEVWDALKVIVTLAICIAFPPVGIAALVYVAFFK